MIAQLKALFETSAPDPRESRKALQLACAALLMEVATIDTRLDESEREALKAKINRIFAIDGDDLEAICRDAAQAVADSTSLYEFTSAVNAEFDLAQKQQLCDGLWEIALADGELDPQEEALMRRIADLLHLRDSEFIQSKLRVKNSLSTIL